MRFLSVEHELPSREVTNAHVLAEVRAASASRLDPGELDVLEKLIENTFAAAGTKVRYHRGDGETAAELAVRAGRRALASAGVAPEEIDLLIYVGIGRGILEPASANIFQDLLGLTRATGFDVLDACASWSRALHLAHHFLQAGTYRRIMLLNAEFTGHEVHRYELSSLEEFAHWHPSVTIGEAATATVLAPDDPDADSDFRGDFRTQGRHRDLCFVPLPNADGYFAASPQVVPPAAPLQFVSFGLRLMEAGARQLIQHQRERADLCRPEPDVIITHSASDGMSEAVLNACGLPVERAHLFHHRFANTVSASFPLAMSHLIKEGHLHDGDRLLMITASAGITTGLTTLVYRS